MENLKDDQYTDFYDRMRVRIAGSPTMIFTIERSQGETYSYDYASLYGHDVWESGTLQGQPCRSFIGDFSGRNNGPTCVETFVVGLPPDLKYLVEDWTKGGGTTHIPVDIRVSHLPEDE